MQGISPTQKIAYHPDTPKIKLIMWCKGITGEKLAEKAGCHPATISRVITGQIKDGRWLEWLAKQLRVPLKEITDGNRN